MANKSKKCNPSPTVSKAGKTLATSKSSTQKKNAGKTLANHKAQKH
ncbi:hypothetical protein [Shouchella clausii]|nr:hypothetical protein [Shouchella clausii]